MREIRRLAGAGASQMRRGSRFVRRELEDKLVLLDEIEFLPNPVLDIFRVMLQAVDGAGQTVIFRRQPDVVLFQPEPLLPEAKDIIKTPVAEQDHQNHGHSHDQGNPRQELVASPHLRGLNRRSR